MNAYHLGRYAGHTKEAAFRAKFLRRIASLLKSGKTGALAKAKSVSRRLQSQTMASHSRRLDDFIGNIGADLTPREMFGGTVQTPAALFSQRGVSRYRSRLGQSDKLLRQVLQKFGVL